MPTWDPDQYLVFDDARTRPAAELLARIQSPAPGTVVDVGCGPGNSTSLLIRRWPKADVTGIDTSTEMLDRARSAVPQAEFVEADLRTWAPPSAVDVVFSNATLQWVEDHPAVFRHLLSWLAPGGVLAVQMPSNFSEPSHTELRAVAASKPWRDHLRGVLREDPVAAPEFYHRLLKAPGRAVDVWTTEYLQVLSGEDPVLEWTRATALRPVLEALPPESAERFVADYASRLADAYPTEADGTTYFPFRRLFIVVTRG